MSFTFSNNQEVDYPALGMCDTCGKRFTQGCEHSNTLEAQQWLAAYLAVEQNRDNVDYCIRIMEETRPHPVNEAEFVDGFCDERLNNYNIAVYIAAYNVLHASPENAEWAKKRLEEEVEKREKYIGGTE